MSIDIIKVFIL